MSKALAEQYFEDGDWPNAAATAQAALQGQAADPALLLILAVSAAQCDEHAQAIPAYTDLIQLEPGVPEHWLNLALSLRALGHGDDAETTMQQAHALGGDGPDLWFNWGLIALDQQRYTEALKHLASAYQAAPIDASIACAYAETLFAVLQTETALNVAREWRNWDGLTVELLPRLGNLLFQLGDAEQGCALVARAVSLDPNDASARLMLAGLLERSNKLDAAQAQFIAMHGLPLPDGQQRELHLLAARLAQRRGDHATALSQFAAAAPGEDADAEFALAKSQDALGQTSACLATLARAHAAQLQHIAHIRPAALADTQPFGIANFSANASDIAAWHSPTLTGPRDPLFVVAFPRSGTTLLEQMLDAHPQLAAMDEQPFLQLAIQDLQAAGATYPEGLAPLSPPALQLARDRYFERVSTRVTLGENQRLVDKNPLNLLRLPAIQRLFPQAAVVLIIRHPCDVLLSCLMQPFRAPEFAVMCRDLSALAQGYVKAFDFFYAQQALLNAKVLEIRYESLVADVDGHTRQLCEFADLPWHPAMLNPSAHALAKGYISTPSYTQVVQPVNSKAVNKWRRYAEAFAPIMPTLAPYLQRWGYEGL